MTTPRPFPWRHVHFVGIGGVGMSGLAAILLDRGVGVSGSDAKDSVALDRLRARGARLAVGHAAANLAEADLVVHSSAVGADNPEVQAGAARGIPTCRRGEFLARLADAFDTVIAVGGSHGKTTTTALIAHILRELGFRPGYLVGGEVSQWASPAAAGAGHILVTEVDESDGTQALLRAAVAVVTNVDDDHCWSLGGVAGLEQCFRDFAGAADALIAWRSPKTVELFGRHPHARFLTARDTPSSLRLQLKGDHNRGNATLAIAAAAAAGADPRAAARAAASFAGVQRRLTVRYRAPDGRAVIVEDYAHHPAELKASLDALRAEYPGHRLVTVFQPHRFERIRRYADAFARVLSRADDVTVYGAFSAWVKDTDIADPAGIAAAVRGVPARYWDGPRAELAHGLAAQSADGAATLYAIIGAGDVCDLVAPLRDELVGRCLDACAAALVRSCPGLRISRTRPWRQLTSLGVGAAVPLLVEPATSDELAGVLRVAGARGLPVLPLGEGSNLVGTDEELPVVVVRLSQGEFVRWTLRGQVTVTGAGAALPVVLKDAMARRHLPAAAAALAWIPGSVGGAVRMNAGAGGASIGEWVHAVRGIDRRGRPWRATGRQLAWGYRQSSVPADVIVTSVTLRTPHSNARAALRAYRASGAARRRTQPRGRSAGCVFRNPGTAPAGRLIDAAGGKGLRAGGCTLSAVHANFLVADAGATERDVISLMMQAQRQVYDRSGIILRPEVVFANSASAARLATAIEPWKVAVLLGGPSKERTVSLRSGAAVAAALRQAGHCVTESDVEACALPPIPAGTEVVFPVLHGTFGEDGGIQALLERAGFGYVGSGVEASRLIMSKVLTKERLAPHGIPMARHVLVSDPKAPAPALDYPLLVKPNAQGSSVGMTKLRRPEAWRRALRKGLACDSAVLVEEFIEGTEITVGVLFGEALPVVEIVPPKGRTFDNDAKYAHSRGHTHYYCPPKTVPAAVQKRAQECAVKAYALLGAKDMLRVDFIVDRAGVPRLLEGNSIPGFTATSLLPKAAAAAGISFVELCVGLVRANRG
ncbi:MAG: UDP-N-acetylmuramate--L-alanine ligase [Lentisphaerae bacterium ADurb.BinA184]|nr:MAG: UDP-N-acetylmuramate--L-alanine ligase [Lentisphaerae bacterium ADurb.BinA184]